MSSRIDILYTVAQSFCHLISHFSDLPFVSFLLFLALDALKMEKMVVILVGGMFCSRVTLYVPLPFFPFYQCDILLMEEA